MPTGAPGSDMCRRAGEKPACAVTLRRRIRKPPRVLCGVVNMSLRGPGSHCSPGSQTDRLCGPHWVTREAQGVHRKAKGLANCAIPQSDLGQSSLGHLPVGISGAHLANLGLRFLICEVDRVIPAPEGGGQVQ